ncbi:MAG: hypothetical protein KDC80_02625 [Saprospiraceae bacterium]|nr:hypothetical protein [Saprospiraceae bacterium]
MKRKHLVRATIWCISTILIVDLVSYLRHGDILFLDFASLRRPLLLLLFLIIVVGMLLGFAKFLSLRDKSNFEE